jgi:hypothetical protein
MRLLKAASSWFINKRLMIHGTINVKLIMYFELETVEACVRALFCMMSGFRREVDKNCALLGYYAASSGNLLQTFRDNLSVPSSGRTGSPKEGTDMLSRNNPERARFPHYSAVYE